MAKVSNRVEKIRQKVELRDYTDRFPYKELWHKHQLSMGNYLPNENCYNWTWGIRQALKNQCNFKNLLSPFSNFDSATKKQNISC